MPVKPRTPCAYPGCPALSDGCYCPEHQRQADRFRGSASSRGYDSRWKRARKAFLRANPVCAECSREGRFTAATVVDHIRPHKGDMDLFWDRTNWQPLCASCHSRKTASEDGGFANPVRG